MIVKLNIDPIGNKRVVAICDNNLLGKKFEEKGLMLDLNCNFFKGECASNNETKKIINSTDGLNIVGEKSIEFCIKENYINKKHISKIKNIPYAFVLVIRDE